jgi:hypothetical protein
VSSDLLALLLGTILAVGALAFVLHPLFFGVREYRQSRAATPQRSADDSAIVALREIEFDRATGKLSDADYAELRGTYTNRALDELRGSRVESPDPVDPIEAKVRAYRAARRECQTCGLRPEPDAVYCSTCGGYLERACPDCGAVVTEAGAMFCSTCGARLSRGTATMFSAT